MAKENPNKFVFDNSELRRRIKAACGKAADFSDAGKAGLTAHLSKQSGKKEPELTFYYRVTIDGERKSDTVGKFNDTKGEDGKVLFGVTDARDTCDTLYNRWEQDIRYGRRHHDNNCPTLDAFIQQYAEYMATTEDGLPSKWLYMTGMIRLVYGTLMDRKLNKISNSALNDCDQKYLEKRFRETGKRPFSSTRNAKSYLMPILRYGIEQRFVQVEEFINVKVPQGGDRERFVLPGEWQKIAKALDGLDWRRFGVGQFVRFLLYMGVRLTMAAKMKWTDVHEIDMPLLTGGFEKMLIWRCIGGPGTG